MSKQTQSLLLAVVVLGVGLGLRYHAYENREFWGDETCQIGYSKFSLPVLILKARASPGGFPGDYVLIHPFVKFSSNKWVITLPHLTALLIGFYLLYRIGEEELHSFTSKLITYSLVAFNRNLIFNALEIRPYAVLFPLALAMYRYSRMAIQKERWSVREKIGWGFLLIFVISFHPYGLLMVFFILTYHLVFSKEERSLKDVIQNIWKPTLTAWLIVFPLWVYLAYPNYYLHYGKAPFEFLSHSLLGIASMVFGNLGDVKFIRFAWLLPLGIIVSSFFLSDSKKKARIGFMIWMIVVPVVLIMRSDIRAGYWFLPRQFSWMIPLWAILAGLSLDTWIAACDAFKERLNR